ncbi:MAG: ABC transporter ATP-binding protein [Eubacteriaceae bacterium]|nr:ABC transporter ATP-binding protein [Eubacteriaceae bacterium]
MSDHTSQRKKAPSQHGPGPKMGSGEKARDFKGTIKKLLSYLGRHKIKVIIVFVFAIVSTVFTIVSPAILGDATDVIVDGLMGGKGIDFDKLLKYVIFLTGLYGVSFVFSFGQGFIMAKVSQSIIYDLRDGLSRKMDKLPLKYFDTKTHGEIQSRVINDIETINQTLSQSLTQVITSVATIIGILIMMVRISLTMTITALIVLPLSMILIKVVVSHSQKQFQDQQKYLGDVNGHVEEMFTGHTIVKAFGKEAESTEKFNDINGKLFDSAWRSQFLSGLMMPAATFIGNLGYVAVCILGGYLAIHGKVSIGNIQSFIQYVRQFNQPIAQVANVTNLLQSTAAAAERVFEFIDEDEEPDAFGSDPEGKLSPKDIDQKGQVQFDHVSFGYDPGETVINDFSYTAPPGSSVAIVGPTGAGKTTIVKLLMRYYELNKGAIRIDGHDITDFTRKDLRNMFSMVLQDTWLFSGTMRENIAYGKPDASDEEIVRAAKAAHIHHYIKTLPGGYDMPINEEATNISQGQKQLLTIARAMLADKPILLLDEATSSVDTRTERQIQKAMNTLMEGRTSFVIAHRLSTIKDADMILVMNHGDIVEQGKHNELLAQGGFYAKLYNSQFA